MGKRAVIYTAGMLFVSPMVYTKDVGSSGTLPAFQAGDPDCVLPAGLAADALPSATLSPLLRVKSHRAPSTAFLPAATEAAVLGPQQRASRRAQYGRQAAAASRPQALGPLGPTGPTASQSARQYASAPPPWAQNGPASSYAMPAYPQRSALNTPMGGYPRRAAMPSFGAWPSAQRNPVPQQQPRRQAARKGSGMGMGAAPSARQPMPAQFAARPQQHLPAVAPAVAAAARDRVYPAMPVTPTRVASYTPPAAVAAPAGWAPYPHPAYRMPVMPRMPLMPLMPMPVPYGALPQTAAIAPAASAGSSQREAKLVAQVQKMEQRLRDLEARLQQDSE